MPTPHACQYIDECDIPKIASQLDQILVELQALKSAFPEDHQGNVDVVGHRKYHDAKILAAQAEEAFWRELKLDLVKKGAWAIILVVVGLIMTGAAVKLGLGSPGR